jgi:hypothetical protein
MSRIMIALLLLFVLAATAIGVYGIVFPRLMRVQLEETNSGMAMAARLLQEMDQTELIRLKEMVAEISTRQTLLSVLEESHAFAEQREAWLNQLRAEVASISIVAKEHAPVQDIFILDSEGKGIVRNIDMHWTAEAPSKNQNSKDLIQAAKGGSIAASFLMENNRLMRVVCAPLVGREKKIVGALYVAFPVDDAFAKLRSSEVSIEYDFAYVAENGIVSSTLSEDALAMVQSDLQNKSDVIQKVILGKSKEERFQVGSTRKILAMSVPMIAPGGERSAALIIFRDWRVVEKPLQDAMVGIILIAGAMFFVSFLIVMIFGGRLTRALKEMESEALEISGGEEKAFSIKGPTIVRSIAGLMNQIRGKSPKETESIEQVMQEDDLMAPSSANTPSDQVIEKKNEGSIEGADAKESPQPDDDPLHRVFIEFVQAKERLGEKMLKLGYERFRAKLAKQEDLLKRKHGCQSIKFEVVIRGRQVSLRPRILR